MKKLNLSLLFLLVVLTASSQKVYFVYIQTESEQPFFVKMNGKVQSSTAAGYIILAKLVDSTYNFSVGFPQNKWPEQNFSVSIDKKDHGYLLKNFNEKGWGLFNLQTLAVQMAIGGKASVEEKPTLDSKDVSAFTEILSKAADDPSLKEKPILTKIEEKKTDVAVQEIKKEYPKAEIKEIPVTKPTEVIDQAIAKTEEVKDDVTVKTVEATVQPIPKQEEVKVELREQPLVQVEEAKTIITESYKTSQVKKWSESSTTEGFGLVFIDDYENGTKDTIRLVIPNPKPVVTIIKDEPKEEKKFLDISTDSLQKEDNSIEIKPIVTDLPIEKAIVKNYCNEVATENDFFKLRKKMAAVASDDAMIIEAKKIFKIKCFNTAQIKNLSTLFLSDEGKYTFFDAAYKYVSDAEVFNSLQTELRDEYYATRFKAMLRN